VTPSENDQFAPNDGFESAASIPEGFSDATIWGSESDYYRIEANSTDALDLEITDRDGDLALNLYDPNRNQLAGDDFGGDRSVTLKAPETGTYFVEVTGDGQQITSDYTLRVDKVTPSENDRFAPNGDISSAAILSDEFTDATIWGGESDFYRVGMNASEVIDLGIVERNGDIALRVYGPDQTQIDSDSFGGDRSLTIEASDTGTYFVEVAGEDLQTTTDYQLRSNRTGLLPSQSDELTLTVTDEPESASPGEQFTVTYGIENGGSGATAYTLESTTGMSNVTVAAFSGQIESSDVDNEPPSASTEAINVGETASVTVTYDVASNVSGIATVSATARDPLSQSSSEVSREVSIQSVPTDPTQRALQIADKNSPSEFTQNDVTATITRFNRGQSVNGVEITQNDVTTVITLFERN
jgi:hypothetical protein